MDLLGQGDGEIAARALTHHSTQTTNRLSSPSLYSNTEWKIYSKASSCRLFFFSYWEDGQQLKNREEKNNLLSRSKDLHARLGDQQGVLELSRALAINSGRGPVVRPGHVVPRACWRRAKNYQKKTNKQNKATEKRKEKKLAFVDHRFNGETMPRPHGSNGFVLYCQFQFCCPLISFL